MVLKGTRLQELTDLLVMDNSEKPLKGSEKIGLCNYRGLCLLELQKFRCILGISARRSQKKKKKREMRRCLWMEIVGSTPTGEMKCLVRMEHCNPSLGGDRGGRRAWLQQTTLVSRKSHGSWEPAATF